MRGLSTLPKAILLIAALAWGSPATAQDLTAPVALGPEFNVDVITFSSERGTAQTVVEVYVSVAYDQLAFTRAGEVFRADHQLQLRLVGPRGETVFDEMTHGESSTPLYEETLAEDIFRLQRFTFLVRPGDYQLDLQMTDRTLNKQHEKKLDIRVPRYLNNSLGVSDILLTDFLGASSPDLPVGAVIDHAGSEVFTRKGHSYVPNTRAIYANFAPSLLAYYEVYGLNPLRRNPNDRYYKVEFYVNNWDGDTVLYYMRQHDKPGSNSFNSVEMNIQDLAPGDYQLQVNISDLGTGKTATSAKPFTVLASYISLALDDYEKAVRQLRYIASERELRLMRQADEDDRLRLFKQFWVSRDPSPATRRNETLIEYYRRINYANEQFKVPQLEGWATDRGMVYVTLGLPDFVEREEFSATSKPVEVWVYNSVRLRLLFVDESGFGDYVLQNRQEFDEKTRWRRPRH
jgi:GWxTD domain-containing protein